MVDWSDLPYHIVELMMNKLLTLDDYIRCGAVCTSWKTIFIDRHHHPPPNPGRVHFTLPPPVLIVPTPKKNKRKKKKKTKSLSLYSIISERVINQFQVTIPNNRYFCGSSHSWLVAVDNDRQIRLFNPFCYSCRSSSSVVNNNNYEILLPSLKHLPILNEENPDDLDERYCTHDQSTSSYAYLKKTILSADPSSDPTNYIVMAIFGAYRRLAFFRPGHHDKTWTLVENSYMSHHGYELSYKFRDVIYYKGKFFALHLHGPVVVLDPAQNMMAVTLEIPPVVSRLLTWPHDTVYLVELEGVLLQVFREVEVGVDDIVNDRQAYSTTSFQVFELMDRTNDKNFDIAKVNDHQDGRELNWKFMTNLRGHTLFLGHNHSLCICASDSPGCKPNSIYFTDDYMDMYHCSPWNGPHDLGVFNLEDKTIENHYPTNHNTPIWPVPIWIQPIIACITGGG